MLFQVSRGYVRLGLVMSDCQVRSVYVRLGKVISGYVMLYQGSQVSSV